MRLAGYYTAKRTISVTHWEDENTTLEEFENAALILVGLGLPTRHTNPSQNRSFSKTRVKPKPEFENTDFAFSAEGKTFWKRLFLKTMTSSNYTISLSVPQRLFIAAFSNCSGLGWAENKIDGLSEWTFVFKFFLAWFLESKGHAHVLIQVFIISGKVLFEEETLPLKGRLVLLLGFSFAITPYLTRHKNRGHVTDLTSLKMFGRKRPIVYRISRWKFADLLNFFKPVIRPAAVTRYPTVTRLATWNITHNRLFIGFVPFLIFIRYH